MADNHSSSSTPIRPAQILDPYPERVRSASGVRQTTHLVAVPDLVELQTPAASAPTPVAASFQPLPPRRRRFAAPIASTLLTILGQAVLGALIATRTVDPVLGLMIFVGWLTCGLALIAAQCAPLARSRT